MLPVRSAIKPTAKGPTNEEDCYITCQQGSTLAEKTNKVPYLIRNREQSIPLGLLPFGYQLCVQSPSVRLECTVYKSYHGRVKNTKRYRKGVELRTKIHSQTIHLMRVIHPSEPDALENRQETQAPVRWCQGSEDNKYHNHLEVSEAQTALEVRPCE